MNRKAASVVVGILTAGLVAAYVWFQQTRSNVEHGGGFQAPSDTALREESTTDAAPRGPETRIDRSNQLAPPPLESKTPHALLNGADEAVLADGREGVRSTAGPKLNEAMQVVIRAAGEADEPASLTIDFHLDETIFPPEIVPPTFLWHEPDAQADTWLIDVAFADESEHIYVLSA
ncbi:MAG: hypothetical protein MUF25_20530, partial [Pirellulaceae bacterium]|nr:hypothetical protein [Pirellulaceae bacterium]